MGRSIRALTLATLLACHLGVDAKQARAPAGVVVETTGPVSSGASAAGLRPGDVILQWAPAGTSPAAERTIETIHDWMEAQAEHGVRLDGVRISLLREGTPQVAALRGGAWLLDVAPALAGDILEEHRRARGHSDRREHAQAASLWRALAERTDAHVDPGVAPWFALKAGAAELSASNVSEAGSTFAAARAQAARRRLPLLEREALSGMARAALAGQQAERARQAWADAVSLLERERPASPALVGALNRLAQFQREFGPLDESGRTDRRAVELARLHAPGSIAETASLNGLSMTARRSGNLAEAERLLAEAGAVLDQFPATHPDRVANIALRGQVLAELGRLSDAEQMLRQAESLERARGTAETVTASALHTNLGIVAARRGDFARAEVYLRSALDAADSQGADPLDLVQRTMNLAIVTAERGDHQRALGVFERALDHARRLAPSSPALADALTNVGAARLRTGDSAGGTAALEEALRIREATSPDRIEVAGLLLNLASDAERRGDLDRARVLAARAVAQADRVALASPTAGRAYHVAARVAMARGDRADARRLQEAGLDAVRRSAPGSRLEVMALAMLARLDRLDQRLEQAAARYAEAADALSHQVRRLGAAPDVEAAFVDETDVQRPYVDVLLELGRREAALEAVERFRARAVLDRLLARDLTFGRDAEAAAVARERRTLASSYDATLAELGRLPAAAADKAEALRARLRDLRERQSLAASNLRRIDPALADGLAPPAVSLAQLQQAVPDRTLALVYHLGADRPSVFALSGSRLRVVPLGDTSERIQARVETWRRLMERGRVVAAADPRLDEEARALYRALLAPVEAEIAGADRVVIVPDGALHGVAFAALRRSTAADGASGPYLASWKPTSVAPSVSALARLASRPSRPVHLRTAVVLGDPRWDTDPASGALADRGVREQVAGNLAPLPGSRREAERAAAAFAPRSRLLVGEAATEAALKGVARDTAIVHIASHGVVNDVAPLDSALVLAAPRPPADGDNGLLQAWEIFDQVRVDADLVVLSACDTGLGRTFAGEGLLGLTRAFQFAGAKAVAATLWKAPDEATAALMDAFYAALGRGTPVDVALASAQRRLLARDATSHPFYWAAFVIDGDAR